MSFAGESNSSRSGGPNAIDQAAASVLASSEMLLTAPNNAKLHALYPTPAECTSTIAQTVCNSGQIRVTSNSKSLGASSNFHISSSAILDPPVLNVTLDLTLAVDGGNAPSYPVGIAPCGDGWLFGLIESLEVTYSNSNLSNLILRGPALREWTLAQCRGVEEREELLRNAGCGNLMLYTAAGTKTISASLPLSFLHWQGANVDSGFGFDARTVNGIIQLQINWANNIYKTFSLFRAAGGEDANFALCEIQTPAFKEMYLSFRSYQLMDSTFSVANALATNPYLKYVIPGKWVNTYRMEVTGSRVFSSYPFGKYLNITRESDASDITMELTSAPAGMLQAIGIHVRPIAAVDMADGPIPYPWGGSGVGVDKYTNQYMDCLHLDAIQLQYSGQNIVQLNTKKEIDTYMKFIYGEDMSFYTQTPLPTGNAACGTYSVYGQDFFGSSADGDTLVASINAGKTNVIYNPLTRGYGMRKGQLYLIPLMQNGRSVFQDRHFENLPQYSGSTLTLNLRVLDDVPYKIPYEPGAPCASAAANAVFGAETSLTFGVTTATMFGGAPLNPNTDTPIPPLLNQAAINTPPGGGTISGQPLKILKYTRYEVFISYYIASLVVNSNGMVELQI